MKSIKEGREVFPFEISERGQAINLQNQLHVIILPATKISTSGFTCSLFVLRESKVKLFASIRELRFLRAYSQSPNKNNAQIGNEIGLNVSAVDTVIDNLIKHNVLLDKNGGVDRIRPIDELVDVAERAGLISTGADGANVAEEILNLSIGLRDKRTIIPDNYIKIINDFLKYV